MRIVVSNTAGVPLYEQIARQVKAAILAGELAEEELLPSVRVLARDLRISVITTARAYSELEADGFITNVPGKGAYVRPIDTPLIREQMLRRVEDGFASALQASAMAGLDRQELHQMLDALAEADHVQDQAEGARS